MKQIHIWPNHVHITDIDLVLVVGESDPVEKTLDGLSKLGFDTRAENVEVHDGVVGGDAPPTPVTSG